MTTVPSEHRQRQAEEIVHATLGLVWSNGVSALSMSAIAQASGVSRQTLYKYFPDVEAVLRAAIESSSHDLTHIESQETPIGQLKAYIKYVLEAAAAGHPSPSALEPVLAPDTRADMKTRSDQVRSMLAAILRRGMDDGVFRPDLDADLDAQIVYQTVMGVSDLAAHTDDPTSLIQRAERAVLAMLGHTA